ncbi:hypothetical protein WQ57_01445 [Mesobacillus campisalis]|uniref:Uncharacterized protein n=1 Tax=Mesobacillus campisalis TaxID=1408103 RepID=A0A0M2T571_9BACI|nr:hypothetical protein [Mesobacillus campisalis]KKK39965.1 hypothetical protein WQ57_01445 [Mesobacillus campisalis]
MPIHPQRMRLFIGWSWRYRGDNASKFGIYRSSNGKYCMGAAYKKKELSGEELGAEFSKLREQIVKNLRLAEESEFIWL